MAKTDKAIPEEIPIEEVPAVIQEIVASQTEETLDQREERLKREDYARRNLQAIKEREEIFRRNGLLKEGEPFSMDPEVAVNQRCCF